MPANRNLFMPADGLSIRDPLSNERRKGNIMNPRRYAEFGGLASGSVRGVSDSTATVQTPETTQRSVPVKG
jgi:hypothetical protein